MIIQMVFQGIGITIIIISIAMMCENCARQREESNFKYTIKNKEANKKIEVDKQIHNDEYLNFID